MPSTATQRRGYIHNRQNVVLSCALNSKRKAAVSNTSHIHKGSVGILKQSLNHGFRFAAIHNLRVDEVEI